VTESPLGDGEYSVFIIDVDDGAPEHRGIEITITAGDHKGEVLTVVATHLEGNMVDLVGMPATLTVTGGSPHLRLDA
jgi:hypothetical protein